MDKNKDNPAQTGSTNDQAGDVETAGETTAAGTISGPADNKPVGSDTMVKVAGDPNPGGQERTTTEDLVREQGEDSSDEPES